MIIDVIAQTRLFYSSEETSEKQETLISVYRDNRCRDVINEISNIRERGVYDYDYRCYCSDSSLLQLRRNN